MMVEACRPVCLLPPAYRSKSALSSPHSSLSFSVTSWRFNYLLNQKKRVMGDEGGTGDSTKFNSDWDSLVDSELKTGKAAPLYSVEEFDPSDFRPIWIGIASLIMIFFLATSGAGEESGVFFSLIFFCGVRLYFLSTFGFMAMMY